MVNLSWKQKEDRERFVAIVRSGGVIVGSTDTVLGLFAPLTSDGYAQLDAIKQRNNKPYLVMVAHVDKALHFVAESDHEKVSRYARKYWPGPVTLICNAKKDVPNFIALNGKIALRVPDKDYLQQVLQHFDGLFSTSANITGEEIPKSVDEIDEIITKHVAAVIDSTDKKSPVKPSTIFDITTDDLIEIRR